MTFLLWQHLAASARRYPERTAVVSREAVLSYADLDEQSDRLAAVLLAHGLGRGTRIGIDMPKSARSVVAMLGILKAGAAYVPVDPASPAARTGFILNDCAVGGLVSTSRHLQGRNAVLPELNSVGTIILADDGGEWMPPAGAKVAVVRWQELAHASGGGRAHAPGIETDPAYLLYTSGSTGNPKGVILSHRHALTFVDWAAHAFALRPEDRISNHAPLHFDLSIFDIFGALKVGACVALVPDAVSPFPMELARWIDAEKISVWYSVPSALIRLLLHGKLERFEFESLRQILFAGEVLPVKYLRQWMSKLPKVDFYNLYGPTETNVCTYYAVPRPLPPQTTDLPIGKACENTEVLAIDGSGRRIAPGETGELYVKGASLLLGYWGLPEKTKEVLVANPLEQAFPEQVYRTGDLVRLEADGNYAFLGRKDHMVKSRGYRIELGEVERAVNEHDQVKEAVVLADKDEEIGSRLRAVVVLNIEGSLDKADLQAFCLTRLPKYMVPEEIEFRTQLPRTSTGKADRMALARVRDPAPEEANHS